MNDAPIGIVYCAVFKQDGRRYYGQTTSSLEERKAAHARDSKYKRYRFLNFVRKYGIDAFEWSVIESCLTQKDLDDRETFFIDRDKTLEPEFGFNSRLGSRNGRLCEETKKKMSEAHKGLRSPMKGKHHTEEARKQIALTLKGRPPWNKGIKIGRSK